MRQLTHASTARTDVVMGKRHVDHSTASRGKHGAGARRMARLKRVYEPADSADGLRVLVDRLWPRGLRKDKAQIDLWLKDLAPSTELRRWFGHDPARWAEFRRKYITELRQRTDLLHMIENALRKSPVTLLFAARDVEHNEAVVLKDRIGRD